MRRTWLAPRSTAASPCGPTTTASPAPGTACPATSSGSAPLRPSCPRDGTSGLFRQHVLDGRDQDAAVRRHLAGKAQHLLASAVDQVFMEVPLRRGAGEPAQLLVERVGRAAGDRSEEHTSELQSPLN